MSDFSIAVIISTYNAPDYLRRVLEGFRLQSRIPDELIVADDGSADETSAIIAAFAASAHFPVRHVWHEDRGFRLAEIRNRAIISATADYLLFTDGDCIPHPSFVEDHGRVMRKGSFVTGKRMLVGKNLAPFFNWRGVVAAAFSCLHRELSGCHHLIRFPLLVLPKRGIRGIRGCNLAIFRSDLFAINGFNERITGWGREDSELVARLIAYGVRRRETPFSALVFHLWHPENSRSNLNMNDQLLEETISSKCYRCSHGISKMTCTTSS